MGGGGGKRVRICRRFGEKPAIAGAGKRQPLLVVRALASLAPASHRRHMFGMFGMRTCSCTV